MLNSNLGDVDRIGRIILGVAMLIAYTSAASGPFTWLLLLGLLPMISGMLGTCPIYARLNISTHKLD